jgi:hypothetical protein
MDPALLFEFEREPIMEHCKKLASTDEQIKYLRLVLKEYKTKPPDLDPNYGIRPGLVKVLTVEIEYRKEVLEEEKQKDGNIINKGNGLRPFLKNELQENLKPFISKMGLIKGVTVTSKKAQLITRQLIADGWDAKESSVAETLRKMEFVEGRRK